MDAELLEYLETAIREARDSLSLVAVTDVDPVDGDLVDEAHDTLEEALTRIERAKVLG